MTRVICYGLAFLTGSFGRAMVASPALFVVIVLFAGGCLYHDNGSFAYAIKGMLQVTMFLGLVLLLIGVLEGLIILLGAYGLLEWWFPKPPMNCTSNGCEPIVQPLLPPTPPAPPGFWMHLWQHHIWTLHTLVYVSACAAILLGKWVWRLMNERPALPVSYATYVEPFQTSYYDYEQPAVYESTEEPTEQPDPYVPEYVPPPDNYRFQPTRKIGL